MYGGGGGSEREGGGRKGGQGRGGGGGREGKRAMGRESVVHTAHPMRDKQGDSADTARTWGKLPSMRHVSSLVSRHFWVLSRRGLN